MMSLNAIGLIFDIVGVFWLGLAFFGQGPFEIAHLSISRWDFHRDVAKHKATTTFDGRTGTVFMIFGFASQFIYMVWRPCLSLDLVSIFSLLILLCVILYFVRRKVVKRWLEKTEQERKRIKD